MPTETLVTASNVLDAEFNHTDKLGAVIFAAQGELWIFAVDPVTGLFNPSNGKGTLVDTICAFAGDFGNGAEWAFGGSQGAQLIYTKYAGTPGPTTARNARAIKAGGAWRAAFLDTVTPACIQIASSTGKASLGELSPRIHWNPPDGSSPSAAAYWRRLDAPGEVRVIPGTEGYTTGTSRRSIDGTHWIIWAQTPAQGGDAFLYDTDAGTNERLTSLTGGQFVDDAFAWFAPELSGELVFFATVNTGSGHELRVYRKVSGTWTVVNTVTSPFVIVKPYIWSPEPWTSSTTGYVFAMLTSYPNPQAAVNSAIGIANLLTDSTFTVISDGTARSRRDPEYYPYGPGGTYKILYTGYDVGGGAYNGTYFADTGVTIS